MPLPAGTSVKCYPATLPHAFLSWFKRKYHEKNPHEAWVEAVVEGSSVAWTKIRIPAAEGSDQRINGLAKVRAGSLTAVHRDGAPTIG